jgi:hypothetical protein
MDDLTKIGEAVERIGAGPYVTLTRTGIELLDGDTHAKITIAWSVVGQAQSWIDAAGFLEANR